MSFTSAADELYGLPPAEFTAARRRLAEGLARDEARRLTALRRPTVSAWAVNLLVRDDAVGPLLELGRRMRAAWESGDDIGGLEAERAALVDRLVARARTLAAEAGRPLSETAATEVEDTLRAAIADSTAAEAVRDGRLDRPLRHAGFGPLGSVRAAPRRRATEPAPDARRAAEQARAAARAEQARAEQSAAEWRTELDAARERLTAAERRIGELRERLAEAERDRADLERRARVSRREYERAARIAAEARRRADEA